MADDSSGKSIADAYRNWTSDTAAAPQSVGAAIADAYRTQDANASARRSAPTGPEVDEYGNLISTFSAAPDPYSPGARIGTAAAEAWRAPGLALPRVPADLVMSPIYNPIIAGAETALRAGGAVLRGGQQAVVEATPDISLPSLPPGVTVPLGGGRFLSGELTPGPLGREIAALPEAFPFGIDALRPPGRPPVPGTELRIPMTGQTVPFMHGQSAFDAPPTPRFVQEYYGEGTPSNPLAAAPPGERPSFVPPGVNIPPRPVEPPAFIPPGASGRAEAATPGGGPASEPANALTPSPTPTPTGAPSARIAPIVTQAQAEAEADRILRHFAGDQTPVINSAPLASGAQPTLSQSIEGGHGGLAGLERGVRDVPEQTQHFVTRETGNTTLRNKAVGDVIGDPRATDVVESELNARTAPQEAKIFDPSRTSPVDPSDAIAMLDQIRNGPKGQRDAVASSLDHLRSKLIDKDGNMQTDPAQLRGVDLAIKDMISPMAAGTKQDGRAAAHELMAVRDVLRDNIEQGAPGYKEFLAQQAQERSAIDGQRFLQARNITDRHGNVNLGTLDATIKAAERQQRMPGARLADGVTDEQLDRLRQLRADYQNDAKQRLGTSLGSPTVQKLGVSGSMGAMGHPLLAGAAATAGAYMAGINPVWGMALGGVNYLLKEQSANAQRMVMDALRDKLLNPEKARSAFTPR